MMKAYFLVTFSQFKGGIRQINESKAPEWMDTKYKTIEINISNDNRPKMERIDDYWWEEKTIEIVDLKVLVKKIGEIKNFLVYSHRVWFGMYF